MADFDKEKPYAELLMRHLSIGVADYVDINKRMGRQTGADVLAIAVDGSRIGVEVTEVDTGTGRGVARREEKRVEREAHDSGLSVYGMYARNDENALINALADAIRGKADISLNHDFKEFTEAWLLVVCGVPEVSAVVSTFVVTPWITAQALNDATTDDLKRSNYRRAFIYSILGVEEAVYRWDRMNGWEKSVLLDSRGFKPEGADAPSEAEWISSVLRTPGLNREEILERVIKARDEQVHKILAKLRSEQA